MQSDSSASTGPATGNRPRQSRAHATRARLVAAVVDLLRDRPFEEISVAEVAAAAGLTTGAIYSRFGSKNGLLPAIYEHYDAELGVMEEARFAQVAWHELDLLTTIEEVAGILVALFTEKAWLIRAAALFSRTYPDRVPEAALARRGEWLRRLAEPVRNHASAVAHADVDAAVRQALYILVTVIREATLFGRAPVATAAGGGPTSLTAAAIHAAHAYLITPPPTEVAAQTVDGASTTPADQ